MESIYRLVDDSMARHGFEAKPTEAAEGGNHSLCHPEAASAAEGSMHHSWAHLEPKGFVISDRENQQPRPDHLRLNWSRWIRCESSLSFALAPAKPGIIALGEEMVPAGSEGKRMLALFQISETDDLGMALGRLFLPGNPLREQLASGRCFARYAVIEDAAQRSAATAVFQRWMQDSAETASGISSCGAGALAREDVEQGPCGADTPVRDGVSNEDADSEVVQVLPPSISSAWGPGFPEVQNREAREAVRRPTPLPSGF